MTEDVLAWLTLGNLLLFGGILLAFWAVGQFYFPIYNVWAAHQRGLADLAKNDQMIQIAEANGRLQAAQANKAAAIIEAEAVAEQVQRIGSTLTHHDLYLRWQWIKIMEERDGETIYVPTEANLPLLEAGRLNKI